MDGRQLRIGFILSACSLALLALLGSSALAYTITDLTFTSNGQPIAAISPGHPQLVDMSFTTDLNQGYAFLDLSQLTTDPGTSASYSNRQYPFTGCERNATANTTTCTDQLLIMPANGSVTIPYRLFNAGTNYPGNLTAQFTIDNTSPVVTGIATQLCDGQRCYIGSGIQTNVTVSLDDPDGAFDKRLVFYRIGTHVFSVDNCTGDSCTGTALLTCADGERYDLTVTSANGVPTQDDAGNPATNETPVTVICDATPLRLLNVTLAGTGPLGLVTNDGTLTVTATIEKPVLHVTMTADVTQLVLKAAGDAADASVNATNASANATERLQSVQCTKTVNDLQECTLSVGSLAAGRNLPLGLVFTDELGRTLTANVTVPAILNVSNATTTPALFAAKATAVTPGTVDRAALQLALDNAFDYPLFINYHLTRLAPGAKILQQSVAATTCQVVKKPKANSDPFGPNDGQNWSATPALFLDPIRVFYPDADWNEDNRLDASFLKLDTSTLKSDLILVRCNLSLVVQQDNTIYPSPEQLTLYFPLRLHDSKLGTPGKAFLKKIDDEQNSLNTGLNKLVGTANQLTATFAQMCQLQNIMNMLQTPGLQMQAMGLLLMQTGVGQGLASSGNQLWNMMFMSSATYWMGKMPQASPANPLNGATSAVKDDFQKATLTTKKFCDYIYCDVANKTQAAAEAAQKSGGGNWLLAGDQGFANDLNIGSELPPAAQKMAGDYFSNLNTPDVGNSLIMSVATQCWSGVVYNLNKYREIDCGYLECLKEQALDGASITPCEQARGVKMCRFVTGEIFELPYIRVIKNLAANINQIVQSPLTLLVNQLNSASCAGTDQTLNWKGFGCHLMKTLAMQKDFSSVTKYNMLFSFPYQADLCQKALCVGSACGRTTSGFLEQLSPAFGYTGDQYRQQWFAQHDKQARVQVADAMLKSLPDLSHFVGPVNPNAWQSNTAFQSYMKEVGIDTSTTQGAADAASLWLSLNDLTPYSGAGTSVGQNDRNVLRSQFVAGQPITSGGQLAGLAKTGTVPGASLLSTSQLTNDAIAQSLATLKQTPTSNPVCQQGTTYNNVECDKLTTAYNTAAANLYKDTKYAPTVTGEICVCLMLNKDGTCQHCGGPPLTEEQRAAAQKAASDAGHKAQTAANVYGWVDMLSNTLYQYMRENGQLDFLFLSGWGDWGASLSAQANTLLNPEEWKNNLCNPAGAFSDFTLDDGAVYAWQGDNYRAVLTFAAERLNVGARANQTGTATQRLYTISTVAVSPFGDNTMGVILNPGGKSVASNVALAKGDVVNEAYSVNDTEAYTEVCVLFAKPFPQAGGDTKYCRPIEPNAFDRGGVTSQGLPDFGVKDPYSTNQYQANQSAGLGTGTTGLGTGATGFGMGGGLAG